jgi:preprotein translocase subunit SecD
VEIDRSFKSNLTVSALLPKVKPTLHFPYLLGCSVMLKCGISLVGIAGIIIGIAMMGLYF